MFSCEFCRNSYAKFHHRQVDAGCSIDPYLTDVKDYGFSTSRCLGIQLLQCARLLALIEICSKVFEDESCHYMTADDTITPKFIS